MTSGVLHVSLHSKSASWIGFVFTTENRGCGLNRHIFAVLAPTKRAETQSAWRACACRVFVHFYPRVSECVWWFPRWHWKRRRHSVFSVENRVLHFASTSTQKAEYYTRETDTCGGCQKCIIVYEMDCLQRAISCVTWISWEWETLSSRCTAWLQDKCEKSNYSLHCVKIVVSTLLRHHTQIEAILLLPALASEPLQPYICEAIHKKVFLFSSGRFVNS